MNIILKHDGEDLNSDSEIDVDTRMLDSSVAFFPTLQMSLKARSSDLRMFFCKFRAFCRAASQVTFLSRVLRS